MRYNPEKNRARILNACKRNPTATIAELAHITRFSHTTVIKHVKQLKQDGLIAHRFVARGRRPATGGKRTSEQRRIDKVVKRAKLREQHDGCRDVVIDYGVRAISFRARKVG